MRTALRNTTIGLGLVALTIGAAPLFAGAADHLDAPSLGSLSAGSLRGDRDINDVYVFQGSNASNTVIAMTTNPAAGVLAPDRFGRNVRYEINIDNTGDNVADIQYVARYLGPVKAVGGAQPMILTRNGRIVSLGFTNHTSPVRDGGKVRAGKFSDPFFFDLLGFRGTLGLGGTEGLCDSTPSDFFKDLNTMALVLEVPDSKLGKDIGVWATTKEWVDGKWVQRDQMGRPAINTVFNHTAADKEAFNVTPPSQQASASKPFRANTSSTLVALSGGDTEGSYAQGQADALASVLIPDVITYDTSTAAVGPLNGRALADDVIDVELNITTGGDPLGLFADRDGTGAIPSDCVAKHTDYRSTFPYLGVAH